MTIASHSTIGIPDVTTPVSNSCVSILMKRRRLATVARHRARALAALRALTALLALTAPGLLFAQRPGALAATFQGRVYDAVTGTPLVGATVTATSAVTAISSGITIPTKRSWAICRITNSTFFLATFF